MLLYFGKNREKDSRGVSVYLFTPISCYRLFYKDYFQNAAAQAVRLTLTTLIATRYCSGDIWCTAATIWFLRINKSN